MIGEGARQCSGRGADRCRCQQYRREQPDCQARPGAPRGAPPAETVASVDQQGIAFVVLADQHRTSQRDVLGFGSIGQGFEVSASRIEILVTGNDDQRVFFAHNQTPC